MNIANFVIILLLIAFSIILGAAELTGSEELHFTALNIWLTVLAIAFAGGGAWGLVRTFSTASKLTHSIFKLIQRDYSETPKPWTPIILKPLVSPIEKRVAGSRP